MEPQSLADAVLTVCCQINLQCPYADRIISQFILQKPKNYCFLLIKSSHGATVPYCGLFCLHLLLVFLVQFHLSNSGFGFKLIPKITGNRLGSGFKADIVELALHVSGIAKRKLNSYWLKGLYYIYMCRICKYRCYRIGLVI